jgi:hypothetical protein
MHTKEWFGQVKALALLPVQLVNFGWDLLCQDLEHVLPGYLIDQGDIMSLRNFANYFRDTWIDGRQFDLQVWNHFSNEGPRTTNHAEGYHSSLNRNGVPETHMALENFLEAIQREHNRIEQRIRKLYSQTETPRARDALYEELHNQIINQKQLFTAGTAHIWQQNFDAVAMFNFNMPAYAYLANAVRFYLRYQRHRIGDKVKVANGQ